MVKNMSLSHLILMRHAKSSWHDGHLSDHERPLNKCGKRAAKTIGDVLRAQHLFPDMIWSSDSARTRETVALLTRVEQSPQIDFLSAFYHASANTLLYICAQRKEPPSGALMLMGHNPGWEDLLYHFTNKPLSMPTGGCAILKRIDSHADWLDKRSWQLADYLRPKDFE